MVQPSSSTAPRTVPKPTLAPRSYLLTQAPLVFHQCWLCIEHFCMLAAQCVIQVQVPVVEALQHLVQPPVRAVIQHLQHGAKESTASRSCRNTPCCRGWGAMPAVHATVWTWTHIHNAAMHVLVSSRTCMAEICNTCDATTATMLSSAVPAARCNAAPAS